MTSTARKGQAPDRNIAIDLVRVTEAAALAAARWMGRGDKESADQAAVDAMRLMLDTVDMDGIVVIGEGEKDKAPMLFNGERIGNGQPPAVDVAVDPIDGTTLTAKDKMGRLLWLLSPSAARCSIPAPASIWKRSRRGKRRAASSISTPP